MDIVWQILIAAGFPSAIVGIGVWRQQRYFEKREARREEHEKAKEQYETHLLRCVHASMALSEAIALAMQNGKCNGETEKALAYCKRVKHDQKDFITELATKSLFQEMPN